MEDNRRSLTTLLLVSTLVAGGYLAYSYYFAKPSDQPTGVQGGGGTSGPATNGPTPADREARAALERTATLRTDEFEATVSNLGGGLKSMRLLRERYRNEQGGPEELVTTEREEFLPLRLELRGLTIPPEAVWELEQRGDREVRLRYRGDGFVVTRSLLAGQGPYQIWSTVRVTNTSARSRAARVAVGTFHYVAREDESSSFLGARSAKTSHGVCRWGDGEITRLDREKALAPPGRPRGHGFGPNVGFVGTETSYFASVLAASGEPAERCVIRSEDRGRPEPTGSLFAASLVYPRVELAPGESTVVRTLAYLGPKDADALLAAGHALPDVVDLGWFSIVARYFVALLRTMYSFAGNWGLAIILMTILVRLLLLPLTWKSFQSMAQLRVLKPEMDLLTEKYKDDPQAKGAAMMALYKKRGVSPFGGCLPSLLQMPIWFAFYASLSTNVELYHAEFILWYHDLSAPDPYFVLPLTVGVLMHFQQRLTPAATDAAQAKILLWMMPIMITGFMLFLPAGLCVYMVTNSVLGMGQQLFIQRRLMEKERSARAAASAAAGKGGSARNGDGDEADEDEDHGPALVDDSPLAGSVVRRTLPKDRGKKRRSKRARP